MPGRNTRYTGGSGGKEGAAGFTDAFSINVKATDTVASPTDSWSASGTLAEADTVAAPSDALAITFPASDFQDTNQVPTDSRSAVIRCWSVTSVDNDKSLTTPTNANGPPDSKFAEVKTGKEALDTTNPVVLTSSKFVIPEGTYSSKVLRVWFDIPVGGISGEDKVLLRYNVGGGPVTFFTRVGTTSYEHNSGDFTFDVSTLTVAELKKLELLASYEAKIVLTPETVIKLDAWCVELTGTM